MNPASTPSPSRPAPRPEIAAIRDRQQATWADGDYSVVANTVVVVSELLCEAADLHAGSKVLDVATGSGNAALAAARRWCEVVGTDYVPALLERARERAAAERLAIDFKIADADRQPFADASFDVVLSVFGAMFAPDPEATAAELLRVCRPGGTIALASWTPEGLAGRMFKATARFVPPPPGVAPPVLWGTEARIEELFGRGASSIVTSRRTIAFRYRSISHYFETFRGTFGPVKRTYAALDDAGRAAFEKELAELLKQGNRSGDATLVLPSEYLEVVIRRK